MALSMLTAVVNATDDTFPGNQCHDVNEDILYLSRILPLKSNSNKFQDLLRPYYHVIKYIYGCEIGVSSCISDT